MLGKNARNKKGAKTKRLWIEFIPTFLIDIQQGRKRPQICTFGERESERNRGRERKRGREKKAFHKSMTEKV